MMTIQWRPEVNALTTPQSYRPLHVPRAIFGYDELAARIAAKNPLYQERLGKGYMLAMREEIKAMLAEGNQLTLEGLLTVHISLAGRLDSPDAPLPPLDESLQVRIYPSKRLVEEVRQVAHMERLPMTEKAPVISSAEDTVLKLDNVLNPTGLLRLTGADLLFDPEAGGGECVIEGTRSGRTVQARFGTIANSAVMLIPDIPSQPDPWNNEYRVSISTRYSEHGSLRTSTYRRPLRTPLAVAGFGHPHLQVGILTDKATAPHVLVTGGSLTGNSARVRIQTVLNAQDGQLRLNLMDMKEDGSAGNAVTVAGNGTFTLAGFAGSPLTSLEVTVNSYAALKEMVRNEYGGRVVDILDVRTGN